MPNLGKIDFKYPIFPDSTEPNGFLPKAKAAQACWWYYILCQKQREIVGNGPESQIITVETGKESDALWHDTHYLPTGRSLELIYQESLEDIFRYWPAVIKEAERMGLPAPHHSYMNPKRFMLS